MTEERKEAVLETAAIFLSRFISGEIVLLDDRVINELKSEAPNMAVVEEYSARIDRYKDMIIRLQ